MKKNFTELVFILDKSGSMSGLESDTIGGFNSMIKKQKNESGNAFVSTILFNNENTIIHDRTDIASVQEMTEKDYFVGGSTALYDAIGETIRHISNIHKYIRPEDIPEKTLFIITTDGMENSSRHFDQRSVKNLIEEKKHNGWEFIFIGANIDSVETAAEIGISEDRAVNYRSDKKGTGVLYRSVSQAVSNIRREKRVGSAWREAIDDDYMNRK